MAAAYKDDPTNSQLLAELNQVFWDAQRGAMGLAKADLAVSQAPYTEDQIRKFMDVARLADFALFVPRIVSTAPEGLTLLEKGWPKMGIEGGLFMGNAFTKGTPVENKDEEGKFIELFGWMRTEQGIDAPYLHKTEAQARQAIGENRIGVTLNVYAVAGQQSNLLAGRYLDEEGTCTRVLSSRSQGLVPRASFDGNGQLRIDFPSHPFVVNEYLGARSVQR